MWPKWYKPVYSFNWRQTLDQVAAIYKVTPEDILGTSRKEYLTDARWVFMKALRAKGRLSFPVTVRFVPANNRGDRINYPNRMKPYFDGIADALGVNDKRFVPMFIFAQPEAPGRVEVWVAG